MSRHRSVAEGGSGATMSYPPLESRIHTVPILEKVPGEVIPARGSPDPLPVTVQRFMGVLVHPVPAIEMHEKCGVFRDGGKVYLDWSRDWPAWLQVEAGDRLEVGDRSFGVIGIDEVPVVYGALYVHEV